MSAVEGPVDGEGLDVIGEAEAEGQMLMHLRPLVEGDAHAAGRGRARDLHRRPIAPERRRVHPCHIEGLRLDQPQHLGRACRLVPGADGNGRPCLQRDIVRHAIAVEAVLQPLDPEAAQGCGAGKAEGDIGPGPGEIEHQAQPAARRTASTRRASSAGVS